MRETEKRIKAYKAMLPRMKERVVAALSLLAVALTTMVSSTYAWLVLSRSPEVQGLQTNIAANGNLEIALAGRMDENGSLLSPALSAAGDGLLSIVDKNLTWGNLVNLGDPAYALENIVLRPAQLNEEPGALLTSPLYAATYGADGRVEELFSNFGYTYAYSDANGNAFLTEDEIVKKLTAANPNQAPIFKKYGVRAVSSTKVSYNSDYSRVLAEKLNKAQSSITQAQNEMEALAKHEALQTLLDLAGRYLGAEVADMTGGEPKNTAVTAAELDALVKLFDALLEVCDQSANALAEIYKFEAYLRTEQELTPVTGEFLLDLTQPWSAITTKLNETIKINDKDEVLVQISADALAQLKKLRENYQKLQNSRQNIADSKGKKVMYAKVVADPDAVFIDQWLSPVFDITSVTINGQTIDEITAEVRALMSGGTMDMIMNAGQILGILNKIKDRPEVVITKGILNDVHRFTGKAIDGVYSFSAPTDGSSIQSVIGKSIDVSNAHIQTVAEEPYALNSEYLRVKNSTTDYKGSTAQAADTYGLVLDFWVRTNAANTKLTLEGAPVYNSREEVVKVTIDGAEKELYKLTIYINEDGSLNETATGNEYDCEAYIDGGKFHAYDRTNQTYLMELCATDSKAVKSQEVLKETVSELVGYNGVNRVWDDMISDPNGAYDYSTTTTMGSGSCYVFYPQSADDQAQSIQLLKNLRVAFISQDGTLFGTGVLDTEHAIEQAGKVTVPLVCHYENPSVTITNENGEEEKIYYITELKANTPTLVTALVYLDGKELSNDQVLSTNDIQGHLNIQFGTTADLSAMEDPVLREERCTVTATMTDGEGLSTLTSQKITDSQAQRTKHIAVKVEGVTPSRVTAYFQRVLNSTQGIRQREIVFNDQGNGTWTADYEFVNAGDYILREVLVDGVTYELDQDAPISYSLMGYAINSLNFEGGSTASETYGTLTSGATYVTTEQRFTADVVLNFTREGTAPASIKGAFVHQETGNRVTVNFRRDGGVWRGSALFTTTGLYRLERLEIDNDPVGVPEEKILSLNLYLGVTANVYSDKVQIGLNDENPTGKVVMSMNVVADNNMQFTNLPPITLVYSKNGSSTDDNTLRAALVWEKDKKVYEGEFEVTSSGTYTFLRAEMSINGSTNILKQARTAPTLKVTKVDDIPSFNSQLNLGESVFAMNNDASFSITLKKAGPATVDAKILGADGKVYYVRGGHMEQQPDGSMAFEDTPVVSVNGAGEELYTFTFYLPKVGANLSQSGTWTLQELYLTDVYNPTGTFYSGSTENGPLPADAKDLGDRAPYTVPDWYYNRWWTWTQADLFEGDAAAFTVTVSDSIELSVQSGQLTMQPGGTADNVTGNFGATFTPDGILVNLTAGGQPLGEGLSVDNITLIYKISEQDSFRTVNTSTIESKLGGYTFALEKKYDVIGLTNGELKFGGKISDGNVINQGNGVYLLKTSQSLSAAGVYTVQSLTATLVNGEQSRNQNGSTVNAPRIELYTKKPTVAITDVSNKNTTISVDNGSAETFADSSRKDGCDTIWTLHSAHRTATPSISSDGCTANVFFRCFHDGSTDYKGDQKYHHYKHDGGEGTPQVGIKLSGLGSFTSATLNFNDNSKIYSAVTYSTSGLNGKWETTGGGALYTWTSSDTTVTRYIGYMWSQKGRLGDNVNATGKKRPAGTIAADTLTVVANGITFSFPIPTITINNPY